MASLAAIMSLPKPEPLDTSAMAITVPRLYASRFSMPMCTSTQPTHVRSDDDGDDHDYKTKRNTVAAAVLDPPPIS